VVAFIRLVVITDSIHFIIHEMLCKRKYKNGLRLKVYNYNMKQTPVYEAKKPNKFLTGTALFTLLVAILLVVFGTMTYLNSLETKDTLEDQVRKTNQLVEQNKKLSEENSKSSQRAANYAYCNAYLLAKYTQDGKPIVIEDLNSCVVTVFPDGDGAPSIPQEAFQQSVGNGSSSTATTPQSSTGTSSGGTTSPSTPSTGGTAPSTGGTNPTTNNPQQTQSGITLEPGKTVPLLNILPDVKIPGILEIR
jgi:cell division protein FtsB